MPESNHPKRLLRTTLILSAAVLTSFMLVAYSLWVQHNNVVHNRKVFCHAQHDAVEVLRKVILLSKPSDKEIRLMDPAQRNKVKAFYDSALALTKPVNCEKQLRP